MYQFWVITGAAVLGLLSTGIHAETFLNDSALLEQASRSDKMVQVQAISNDSVSETANQSIIEIRTSSPTSKPQPVDPGFTPTHEIMREIEAKREADDRLWRSIFSAFE